MPIIKTPLRHLAALILPLLAVSAMAQVTITGVADKKIYSDQAVFVVSNSTDYSAEARLNGTSVPLNVQVPLVSPDYYELSVRATNNSSGSATSQLVRFLVVASERNGTENGLPRWFPYPLIPSAPAEFVGSHFELLAPSAFPSGLPIPVVARVVNETGQTLRVNGSLQLPGESPIAVLRGFGSGFLRTNHPAGPLIYPAHLAGLWATNTIHIEPYPVWTEAPILIQGAVAWPEGSRIAVNTSLTVIAGSTLTIGAGSVIRLAHRVDLTNNGSILILGTMDRPVVFLPEEASKPWGGFIMHAPNAQLQASGAIFTGSGAETCWFDSQFCARAGAPHSHRGEQALISCIGSGISVALTDSAAISLAGQFGHSVSGGSYEFRFTRFLMQRCTTGGEYTDARFTVNDSAFIEYPADNGLFADGDNDALYLVNGTHGFSNTLFGFCKDDAVDSGASGSGVFNYHDCWFESAFHEANSLSGTGKTVTHYRTVFLNNGQALEVGYESPSGTLAGCLATGNLVGGRFGDNYDWTYNGFLRATDSILIHNYHDVWGMTWSDWGYRTSRMDIVNNFLTAPDPWWPTNTVWNPEEHAGLLAPFFNGPAHSPVGIGFALRTNRLDPAQLANGIPLRLSRFSTNRVSVRFEAEGAAGTLATGTLTFHPGETVKTFSLPDLSTSDEELIRIRLKEPENAELTGLAEMFLVAPSPNPNDPVVLIAKGANWRFLDSATNLGTAWVDPTYADDTWKTGAAQLGFGDGDEISQVSSNRQVTTYFRHAFVVDDPSAFTHLTVYLLRDDGGVVYLNGQEVFRSNLPLGPIDYLTLATNALAQDETTLFYNQTVAAQVLVQETNMAAVEIHQSSTTSSDLSFDLHLTGTPRPGPTLLKTAHMTDTLVFYWEGPEYSLERADDLDGPWTVVASGNPYSVPLTGGQGFFRLRR